MNYCRYTFETLKTLTLSGFEILNNSKLSNIDIYFRFFHRYPAELLFRIFVKQAPSMWQLKIFSRVNWMKDPIPKMIRWTMIRSEFHRFRSADVFNRSNSWCMNEHKLLSKNLILSPGAKFFVIWKKSKTLLLQYLLKSEITNRGLETRNFRFFLDLNFFSECRVGRIRPPDEFW